MDTLKGAHANPHEGNDGGIIVHDAPVQFWLNNLSNQQETQGSLIFRRNWDDDFFPISEGRNLRLLEKVNHENVITSREILIEKTKKKTSKET